MRRMAFWAAVLLFGMFAGVAAFAASPPAGAAKAAPGFSTVDVDGAPVRLEELLKSSPAVVLNFWGLRCGSCIEEIPYLSEIARKFGPAGVKVIGVNSDGIDGRKIKEQLPRIGLTPAYPIVVDPELRIMDDYGVTVTPYTVAIRADGKIAYEHVGFVPGDEKELEAAVAKILEDLRPGK